MTSPFLSTPSFFSHPAEIIGTGASSVISKISVAGKGYQILKKFNISAGEDILNMMEIDIMARISHSCIMNSQGYQVSSLNLVREDKIKGKYQSLGIVMEIMDSDLTNSKTTFTTPQLMSIFKQVILGLEFLHQENILHLDIKPHNILIRNRNNNIEAKITDMGLSIFVNELIPVPRVDFHPLLEQDCYTVPHEKKEPSNPIEEATQRFFKRDYSTIDLTQVLNLSEQKFISGKFSPTQDKVMVKAFSRESITTQYRPIECMWGNWTVSDRSDIWSLGIMMLHVLSGHSAEIFMGSSLPVICQAIKDLTKNREIEKIDHLKRFLEKRLAELPENFCEMVDWMLRLNYYERPSCKELLSLPIFSASLPTSLPISLPVSPEAEATPLNSKGFKNLFSFKGVVKIIELCQLTKLSIETCLLALDIYYRILEIYRSQMTERIMEIGSYNAFFIAVKMLEDLEKVPSIDALADFSRKFTEVDLITMETEILLKIKGHIHRKTPFHQCKCKHDLVRAFMLMSNMFLYPKNPSFTPQCSCREYLVNLIDILPSTPFVKNNFFIQGKDIETLYSSYKSSFLED
jgi:serine/threonine protein kinase